MRNTGHLLICTALWIFLGIASLPGVPLPAVGGLTIDFRTDAWAGADGSASFTVPYAIAGDVAAAAVTGATQRLERSVASNGLGIDDPNSLNVSDQIDGPEVLRVTFANNTPIASFGITGLFGPPDGGDSRFGEQGRVDFYLDGVFLFFSLFEGSNPDQSNGELLVVLSRPLLIDRADFFPAYSNSNNEFAVAGFNIPGTPDTGSEVPEPATMALTAAGLLGLGLFSRRTKTPQH